jgi:hypothetical protein
MSGPLVTVSMGDHLATYDLISHKLPVVDQPNRGQRVDEETGPVELERILRGAVILGEGVVVVVSSLSDGSNGGPQGLDGRDAGIVGLETEAKK